MPTVILNGQPVRLTPKTLIGKGGEADVFKIDPQTVLKLYKAPNDPDYTGNPGAQQGAVERISEHQQKLPAFPKQLPKEVIAPLALAYDKPGGKVVGYTMPFVKDMEVLMRLGDRQYRDMSGIDGNQVVRTFKELHRLVSEVHHQKVVIGDFNDLNVLENSGDVRIVDADSMQFGAFLCHTFTGRFVDPLRCRPDALVLSAPHNEGSDWYAYSIMLLQSLLYVGPYGGVHRPKTGKRLQHDGRVLARITVFDGDVIYPKPALPLTVLPDELLGYVQQIFEKDKREAFPMKLLDNLRWTTCTQCGLTHARNVCPNCATNAGIVKATIEVRGTVTAERVFRTTGRLLHVVNQNGKLRYLYHENDVFYREGERKVITGTLDPELRFRIKGSSTVIGKNDALFVIDDKGASQRFDTDRYRQTLPVFDTNYEHLFWVSGDQLVKDGSYGGSEYIGNVLPSQTMIWTGETMGFGFFQAGQLVRSFLFDTTKRNFNDQVEITSLVGQLVDATCVFSKEYTWFMATMQDQGSLLNRCFVIDTSGKVVAQTTATSGEDSWLGSGIRGHLALGKSLYVATDDGMVRVGVDGTQIIEEQTFPDTEPFVTSHTHLVEGPGGIYAVSNNEITLLKIQPN